MIALTLSFNLVIAMNKNFVSTFLFSIFWTIQLWAAPGDVITEDNTTDPGLPYAAVDGDLVIEDKDDNNSVTPGLYVEGLSDLQGGLMLEGMDVIPLYASGGALKSANINRKIALGEQEISSSVWGLSVMTIDRSTGSVLSHDDYRIWNSSSSSEYDRMANDLTALEDGSVIVVITSTFVWSIGWYDFHEDLFKQLQRMGASSQIHDQCYIGENPYPLLKNYVLIGIPGIGAGNGIEVLNEDAPEDYNSPITTKTAEVSTLLIKAGANGKYVPIGLGNSEALNDNGDGVFQRIGIGTNAPSVELDVNGDAKISGDLTVDGGINGNLSVAQGGLISGGLATDTDGNSGIYSPADNTVVLATNGVERITIDADGNIDASGTLNLEGSANLSGLQLQGMDIKMLYVRGGAWSTSGSRKVVYDGVDYGLGVKTSAPEGASFRGLALMVIDRRDGSIYTDDIYQTSPLTNYDTHALASHRDALQQTLESLDHNYIVVISSEDAWKVDTGLQNALLNVGASNAVNQPIYENNRRRYVLVGIPGIGSGNGLEIHNEVNQGKAPAEIATFLAKTSTDTNYTVSGLNSKRGADGIIKVRNLGYNLNSSPRYYKIARIQHRTSVDSSEFAQFAGTLYSQGGSTAGSQYMAQFSFGSRGDMKPLLFEYGDIALKEDANQMEWRVYQGNDGYKYLYLKRSNWSQFAAFHYIGFATTDYFEEVDSWPSESGWELEWSSADGPRQGFNFGKLQSDGENVNIDGDLTVGGSINGNLAVAQGNLSSGGLATDADGNSGVFSPSDDVLSLSTNGEEQVIINGQGNIGIGTNAPSSKLDVAGDANVSGNLTISGNTQMSGNLTVNGTVTMARQGDIFMGQFGIGDDQGL